MLQYQVSCLANRHTTTNCCTMSAPRAPETPHAAFALEYGYKVNVSIHQLPCTLTVQHAYSSPCSCLSSTHRPCTCNALTSECSHWSYLYVLYIHPHVMCHCVLWCRARKLVNLRIFDDDDKGKPWEKSVSDKNYEILCVSQVSHMHACTPPRTHARTHTHTHTHTNTHTHTHTHTHKHAVSHGESPLSATDYEVLLIPSALPVYSVPCPQGEQARLPPRHES